MNIPLIAKAIVDKFTQDQKLEIWFNGHVSYVDAPFQPYFYSTYPLKLDANKYPAEQLTKTLFSNLQPTTVYKYSFKNTLTAKEHQEEDSIEHQISYTDKVLIDDHNFFTKYPNEQPLKVMHFDIETDTIGMFPTPERNAIIAIGARCGDRKAIFMAETYDNDKIILNKFFDFLQETDPDIITHYNGDSFDIPYMMERMKINQIPLSRWSRNNKEIHKYKNTITIGGRVSFDLYHEAQHDQTLSGIKNLKMKTLAKWLKMPDIKEVPYSEMRNMVNTPKLRDYLISDIEITEKLFNIYFKNVVVLAEMNKIPLNLMIGANASFLPNIITGRKFHKLNIISDKYNGARHPKYIKNKRGALVDTFAPGLYNHPIYKVDYASQYPRIVQTFNLSPETVRIIRYDLYNGVYNFDISNPDKYIFSIPDETSNKNIIISIDMSKRGFLSQFMEDVLNERFDIKNRLKTLEKGSPEYEGLHVRQNALKVVCNVQTGYHGQEYALYGDLGTYCAITGLGRWYLNLAMEYIKNA